MVGFVLSIMRSHLGVEIREVMISNLLLKIPLVDTWKVDCGRARKEAIKTSQETIAVEQT